MFSVDYKHHDTSLIQRTSLTMSSMQDMTGLTSALARLDRNIQITQRTSKAPIGGKAGWTKLILDDSDNHDTPNNFSDSNEFTSSAKQDDFVYLLEPESTPSLVILFVGGAALGQYPHISYSELLKRISKRLNAVVIAAPYPLSLDHYDLSKKTGEALRRALIQCEEKGGYSPDLPKFYLGHSLGSKLLMIALAALGVRENVQGIGFMSYNNFGFSDTISMMKVFADEMNRKGNGSMNDDVGMSPGLNLDQLLEFAGQAAAIMGFEFSPNPEDTNTIIRKKYDERLIEKTKLFIFDEDNLDSSESFLDSCYGSKPRFSRLDGTHLAPVYIKLSIDDVDLPDEAREYVELASGGFQNASFGDESTMNGAVNAVCDWILGKDK